MESSMDEKRGKPRQDDSKRDAGEYNIKVQRFSSSSTTPELRNNGQDELACGL